MAPTTTNAPKEAGVSMQPPRENLVRALLPGAIEIRSAEGSDSRTLAGHFAVFNDWTEINSMWEGRFIERIAPGAFKKTFQENRESMKVLYDHGNDPQLGNKPLGSIEDLREDDTGAYYEVSLLDTSYVRDLIPGLEAGLYGASFRFRVMREEIDDNPKNSRHNEHGLPERTIKEAQVMEFGPVTFPAYASATAGVRSMTDAYLLQRAEPELLREVLKAFAPSTPTPPETAPRQTERREVPAKKFDTREEWLEWISKT